MTVCVLCRLNLHSTHTKQLRTTHSRFFVFSIILLELWTNSSIKCLTEKMNESSTVIMQQHYTHIYHYVDHNHLTSSYSCIGQNNYKYVWCCQTCDQFLNDCYSSYIKQRLHVLSVPLQTLLSTGEWIYHYKKLCLDLIHDIVYEERNV